MYVHTYIYIDRSRRLTTNIPSRTSPPDPLESKPQSEGHRANNAPSSPSALQEDLTASPRKHKFEAQHSRTPSIHHPKHRLLVTRS